MKKALALILLLLIVCFIHASAEDQKPAGADPVTGNGTLASVRYSCSGNSLGNVYEAFLSRDADGTLTLKISETPSHNIPVTTKRYRAADDTLQRIAALIGGLDLQSMSERPDTLEVYDAAHPCLTLIILDDEGHYQDYRISGYINLTPEESSAYIAVRELLTESAADENLLTD